MSSVLKKKFLLCPKCDGWVRIGVDEYTKYGKVVIRCTKCGHIAPLRFDN